MSNYRNSRYSYLDDDEEQLLNDYYTMTRNSNSRRNHSSNSALEDYEDNNNNNNNNNNNICHSCCHHQHQCAPPPSAPPQHQCHQQQSLSSKSKNNVRSQSHEFNDTKFLDKYLDKDISLYSNYYTESPLESEVLLRLKWMDNSPRMSRLRDHRQKRLTNKLEQFELWDIEQSAKQKQYELAREQRYKNIMERLKSQEFCVNLMRQRHESDLETTRDLEMYSSDHLYVDALDDPKTNYKGPISQYRTFLTEMDSKMKHLLTDIDTLNPRHKIEQAIKPRLARTRELYSVEPDIYSRGKKVLKKPNLDNMGSKPLLTAGSLFYPPTTDATKIKSAFHDDTVKSSKSSSSRGVNFAGLKELDE
jgi:hypothetical protein